MSPVRSLTRYLHSWLCWARLRSRYAPERVRRFRDAHPGQKVLCIGSGPSLRDEDLALLDGQVLIFMNRSFELLRHVRPGKAYWVVQDFKNLERLRGVDRGPFDASFRSVHQWSYSWVRPPFGRQDIILMPRIAVSPRGWPVIEDPGPNFSHDVARDIGMTPTVMFTAIQLACYMGAGHIGLLGFDLDYGSGSAHFYDNQVVEPQGALRFEAAVRPVLGYYHRLLNRDGIRLFNCSCRTRDDILPKCGLRDFLARADPRPASLAPTAPGRPAAGGPQPASA